MKSQTHGKQRDRVASYAGGVGGMLHRMNSSGSNGGNTAQPPTQKKKPYRARGCRGGASRKGRNRRPAAAAAGGGQQNEENDPSRLNAHAEKESSDGSGKMDAAAKANNSNATDPAGRTRSMAILPSGGGVEVFQRDPPQRQSCDKPILPGALRDSGAPPSTRPLSAIARPTTSSSARSAPSPGGGGFSFFCISPRSFLSGQRKPSKAPRLH